MGNHGPYKKNEIWICILWTHSISKQITRTKRALFNIFLAYANCGRNERQKRKKLTFSLLMLATLQNIIYNAFQLAMQTSRNENENETDQWFWINELSSNQLGPVKKHKFYTQPFTMWMRKCLSSKQSACILYSGLSIDRLESLSYGTFLNTQAFWWVSVYSMNGAQFAAVDCAVFSSIYTFGFVIVVLSSP